MPVICAVLSKALTVLTSSMAIQRKRPKGCSIAKFLGDLAAQRLLAIVAAVGVILHLEKQKGHGFAQAFAVGIVGQRHGGASRSGIALFTG
jgi:hypothetical protein